VIQPASYLDRIAIYKIILSRENSISAILAVSCSRLSSYAVLILGPVAGVVADWCDRRRLLITASLFCAGAVTMMLLGTSPGRYWVLYLALIAENSGTILSSPALQAMTPAVVGTGPLLSSANSLTSASGGIVRCFAGVSPRLAPKRFLLLSACRK
jgi:Na+/melibiose symporter-like transporter